MEPSAKLSYLLQSIEGEPKEMVTGLPNTDFNYTVAVKLLTNRYGDQVKRTHVLLQIIHSLPSPKHNAKDLRNFLTEIIIIIIINR